MHHCKNWLLSDVPSDITVEVEGTSFALHKFPLASKSGRIRKALAEEDTTILHLPELPGGSEAFELAAKHCYGVELEITASNVAMLRCAASYLEMNLQSDDIIAEEEEDEEELTLESITEAYIDNLAVLPNIADAVAILNRCQTLLPLADELNIIGRCVDAIVSKLACNSAQPRHTWWIEDLSDINIDFFQRILCAMTRTGLDEELSTEVMMHYAQNSLASRHREQQNVVERLVNFLPPGKSATSTSFLSKLLRTAMALDAAPYCKAELEKRLALQLDLATSHDLLVLSYSCEGESGNIFDLDVVHRIVNNFLHPEWYESDLHSTDRSEDRVLGVPRQSAMVKVSDLMDSFLAEIATDQYLAVSKFIGLAELLPENGRLIHDGLYRAIDICLKAHPSVSDFDRKKLCALMDCQRLSQDARLHAARNDRLPIQVVVQVLYFEQLSIRDAVDGDCPRQQRGTDGTTPRGDNYASVRLENRELKFRIARMSIRVTDLERDYSQMREVMASSTSKRFLHFVSHNVTKFQCFLASKMDAVSAILSSYKMPRHLHHNRCQRVLQR